MYLSIAFLLGTVFPISVIVKGMTLKIEPYRILVSAIIYSAAGQLIAVAFASLMGDSIGTQIEETVNVMANTLVANEDILNTLGIGDMSKDMQIKTITGIYSGMFSLLPAFFIIWASVVSYFEYIVIGRIFVKKGWQVKKMPPVREFSMQKNAFLGWFLIYLASFLMAGAGVPVGEVLNVNIDCLFRLAFAYQGISFVAFLFHMKKWPKALWVILVVMMMTINYGVMVLYLLGFIDAIFGLKQRVRT